MSSVLVAAFGLPGRAPQLIQPKVDCEIPTPSGRTSWDGFATATFDGAADATGRFCGELLPDTPDTECFHAHVSPPWPMLCREFKSKACLVRTSSADLMPSRMYSSWCRLSGSHFGGFAASYIVHCCCC